MEGSHRKLSAWFANGLRGYDTDRRTHFHDLFLGKVHSVAKLTNTSFGLTCKR